MGITNIPETELDQLKTKLINLEGIIKNSDFPQKDSVLNLLGVSNSHLDLYMENRTCETTGLPSNGAAYRKFVKLMHEIKETYDNGKKQGLNPDRYFYVGGLFMDIDNFGTFNDQHGHNVGDKVLYGVAQRLSNSIKKENDYICQGMNRSEQSEVTRNGGEEFVAILPNTNLEQTGEVAKRVVFNVSNGPINGYETTISCGASNITIDLETEMTKESINDAYHLLINNADNAHYDAKLSGKNQFKSYNPNINYVKIKETYNALKHGTKKQPFIKSILGKPITFLRGLCTTLYTGN